MYWCPSLATREGNEVRMMKMKLENQCLDFLQKYQRKTRLRPPASARREEKSGEDTFYPYDLSRRLLFLSQPEPKWSKENERAFSSHYHRHWSSSCLHCWKDKRNVVLMFLAVQAASRKYGYYDLWFCFYSFDLTSPFIFNLQAKPAGIHQFTVIYSLLHNNFIHKLGNLICRQCAV